MSAGYSATDGNFHSLFKGSSQVVMASISGLYDDTLKFSVVQIGSFSGATFGNNGVMIGLNFYFVGSLTSYGSTSMT